MLSPQTLNLVLVAIIVYLVFFTGPRKLFQMPQIRVRHYFRDRKREQRIHRRLIANL